jgi:hypothetical protein
VLVSLLAVPHADKWKFLSQAFGGYSMKISLPAMFAEAVDGFSVEITPPLAERGFC